MKIHNSSHCQIATTELSFNDSLYMCNMIALSHNIIYIIFIYFVMYHRYFYYNPNIG